IIQAGGQIVRYDMTSSEIIQTAALAAEPLVAAWSPYGAQIAYIAANNPPALRIETPLASLDELSRTLMRCDLEAETTGLFSAYIASGTIDRMVQDLESSPETQIPAACRQDLLAIANALLQ
ncbi:MAG: hypothetical protein SF162_13945, partial [bacterium]|nr:hypothetical protein [bacterium]